MPLQRLFSLGLAALLLARPLAAQTSDPAQILASQLLGKLSLEEKVSLCHGDGTMSINAIPGIGLTEKFWMSDGPNNVRPDLAPSSFSAARDPRDPADQSTALPRISALAATWDPALALQFGKVIGEEARARGKDMMLGPGVNIVRTPLCGRNFEYPGEDPFLNARIAVADIQGIQSRDVAACVKHYALNNQELNRFGVDAEADDRTLHEIYLPAFEAAVTEAHVLAVMCAYNRFRGDYCSRNDLLLNQILKRDWGFKGLVVSDWGAVHDTTGPALHGLDLEMDSGNKIRFFKQPLLDAVTSGTLPIALLDDKVRRILFVMAKIHKIDNQPRYPGSINTPEHQALAREVAEQSIVLLKNAKGLLPLDPLKTRSLLVIGANGLAGNTTGGGSSEGKPPYEITPIAGIRKLLGPDVKVQSLLYSPADPGFPASLADAAKSAGTVLFFTGDSMESGSSREGEGRDRPDMQLPAGTTEAVAAVLAANPNTVVINQSGAPVEMPWAGRAHTLVQYWFCGMEGGSALARVLFGQVNPSGKLPVTFPRRLEDSPAHALGNYNPGTVNYAEGVLVGYRWFDARRIEPLFPFGYGLSYTTFSLSGLKLSGSSISAGQPLLVRADVTNTGNRPGAEVVQLYVGDPSATVPRPPHELKGFRKVLLQPHETKTVVFTLDARAFSYWDIKSGGWKIDPGAFTLSIGTSSRNLPLQASLDIHNP